MLLWGSVCHHVEREASRFIPSSLGPGERIVFEPYTKEVFEESYRWIGERGIFPEGQMGAGDYASAVISLGTE